MTEQEIFENLCNHLMIINVENSLDNPFFKHCYDICMENKNKMTDASIGKIVDREKEILFLTERNFINEFRKHIRQ